MAEVFNGKNGKTALIIAGVLIGGLIGTAVYAIYKDYDPTIKFGLMEFSLRKHSDAVAVEQTAPVKKPAPALPKQSGKQEA